MRRPNINMLVRTVGGLLYTVLKTKTKKSKTHFDIIFTLQKQFKKNVICVKEF